MFCEEVVIVKALPVVVVESVIAPVRPLRLVVVLPPLKDMVLPERLSGAFTAREVEATPIGHEILFCLPLKVPQSVEESTPVCDAVEVGRDIVQVAVLQRMESAGPDEAIMKELPVAVPPAAAIVEVTCIEALVTVVEPFEVETEMPVPARMVTWVEDPKAIGQVILFCFALNVVQSAAER